MDVNLNPFHIFQNLNTTKKRKISKDLKFDSDKHRVYFPKIIPTVTDKPVLLELYFNDTTKRCYEISFLNFLVIIYAPFRVWKEKYKNFILQLFSNGEIDIDEFEEMDNNEFHLFTKKKDTDNDTYDSKGVLLKKLQTSNLIKSKIFGDLHIFQNTLYNLKNYLYKFDEKTYENSIQSIAYLKNSGKNYQTLKDYTNHSSDVNGYFNDFINSRPHSYTIKQSIMVRNIFKYIKNCPGLLYTMKVARKSRRNYKEKLEKGKKTILFPDMLVSTERSDTLDCEEKFEHNDFPGSCFLLTLPKGTPAYSLLVSDMLSYGLEYEWLLPPNSPFIIDEIETNIDGEEIIHATYAGQLNDSIENTLEYKKMKYIFDASRKFLDNGYGIYFVYPLIEYFKETDLNINLSTDPDLEKHLDLLKLIIKKMYKKYKEIKRNNGHMIRTATEKPIDDSLFMSLNNLGMNNIINNIASKIEEWTQATNNTSAPYNNRLQLNDHKEDIDLKFEKLKI